MAKQKQVVITTPMPTLEDVRKALGISKKRVERIKKIVLAEHYKIKPTD